MSGTDTSQRWEVLVRYRFIEIIALWEGRLTTRHLCEAFGIGRQQASKDINCYNRVIGPGNLYYDKYQKGYLPSDDFVPTVSRGDADDYLLLLASTSELTRAAGGLPLAGTNTEVLAAPNRAVSPSILRPLVQAARGQRRVEVDYVSLNNPDREGRIIVPHTLVWTGLRWHVRAWCEKNRDYRDFVLSRFRGDPELLDASPQGVEGDDTWNTYLEIVIEPDPDLTAAQAEVVAHDHQMQAGQLKLTVRARLLPYLLQLLRLDNVDPSASPLAQQIVVANREELAPWLLG
ncbi:conserved hypothetical protein [Luminiphilus syltensis NOR5-1B]|uniref:Uncharacterized protein n=1 Tax=Luminiphilus syltensis NOR5-1B TaxID=565045 RepID=B8KSB9_9GAMM|nr:WYL domain-containing protein [Luminiphilus syltensis]EED34872.1 conserved hypothetical protein [Luminiphilus syltensis NOR5-1B]